MAEGTPLRRAGDNGPRKGTGRGPGQAAGPGAAQEPGPIPHGAVHPTHRAIAPSDPAHMRQCLSRFATGVTVIATRAPDGRFVGLTANSFNSLSLDPPLILWSLAAGASSLDVFKGQRFFSVNVLSVEQVDIARRFAARLPDRFQGVAVHEGLDGIPLIDGALAWFECERRTQMLLGDHWLFIGEVKRCASAEGSPLIFRHGEFAIADALQKPSAAAPGSPTPATRLTAPTNSTSPASPARFEAARTADATGAAGAAGAIDPSEPEGLEPGDQPFYEEYLPFLLARAGHQIAGGFHRHLHEHDLSMLSWRVLAALSSRDDWTIGELCAASLAKQPTISKLIDRLVQQGMVRRHDDPSDARRVLISLTEHGRATIAPVLQDAAAFNLSLLADYPPEELTRLKRLLRDMIARYPPA
jgi:flavin reductase (DIM6/NTAB) family NADH-FMN oxidoreductase RutF/DNA-binding MarR family transcriptional regulator